MVNEQVATTVIVTHDIEEAVTLADKIVILSSRPGTVTNEIEIPLSRKERIAATPGSSEAIMPYIRKVWESLQFADQTPRLVQNSDQHVSTN
jgi:NitT/TauT family transport system ATP-binding protein